MWVVRFFLYLRSILAFLLRKVDHYINPNSNLDHLSSQPTVTFVRHGETESNSLIHQSQNQQVKDASTIDATIDTPLTEFGHLQAQFTANHLIETYVRMGARKIIVLVSPFERAMMTANPFLMGVPIQLEIRNEPLLQEAIKADKVISPYLASRGIRHLDWAQYLENICQLHNSIQTILVSLQADEHLVVFGHSLTFSLLTSFMFGSDRVILQSPNCSITTARLDNSFWQNKFRENKALLEIYSWEVLHAASIAHLPPWLVSGVHTLTGMAI